jgi:hypothetical protein
VTGAAEDWNYFNQFSFAFTTEIGYDGYHAGYQDAVADAYLGTVEGPLGRADGRAPSLGLRTAMLRAGAAAARRSSHALLRGTAPAGRTLRLTRTVSSPTSYVLTGTDTGMPVAGAARRLREHFTSTLTVPASGRFHWHVNPSTRPLAALAGRREAWTLTCAGERRRVVVGLGEARVLRLRC